MPTAVPNAHHQHGGRLLRLLFALLLKERLGGLHDGRMKPLQRGLRGLAAQSAQRLLLRRPQVLEEVLQNGGVVDLQETTAALERRIAAHGAIVEVDADGDAFAGVHGLEGVLGALAGGLVQRVVPPGVLVEGVGLGQGTAQGELPRGEEGAGQVELHTLRHRHRALRHRRSQGGQRQEGRPRQIQHHLLGDHVLLPEDQPGAARRERL
mmetsp:Transcript_40099/g.95806  ORF Transcript_40099/g.95806 Transcript_40099/m.95806 type:complete len:209 (+) Transcript_40099:426-1052(+)